MNCSKCGAEVPAGSKFCPDCGSPVGQRFCTNCGTQLSPDTRFCPNCGKGVAISAGTGAASAPPPPPASGFNQKNATAEETVIMDTGLFPITYVKSLMSSTNGKLTLTNRNLIFKAGKLQGVGGTATSGLFIPNTKDAQKSKEHFAIALSEITTVDSGFSSITVQAGGTKYKFGGMLKTKEWLEAINRARS